MFTLTDIQKVKLTVNAVDAKGNPATLPTPPSWSVSDSTILSVTPAVDGMSAEVSAVGPEGTAQVIVKADLGGGQSASGTLDVQVVGSAATSLSVTPGAAEPITPAPISVTTPAPATVTTAAGVSSGPEPTTVTSPASPSGTVAAAAGAGK